MPCYDGRINPPGHGGSGIGVLVPDNNRDKCEIVFYSYGSAAQARSYLRKDEVRALIHSLQAAHAMMDE